MAKQNQIHNIHVDISVPNFLKEEFLLKEYERIIEEIRVINKNTIDYMKMFVAFATSVFLYSFGGFLYYDKLKNSGKFFFAYSVFGALLALIILGVTAFVFFQLSNSKKIKVRYWRSLDIIRGYIKNEFPAICKALPFPPFTNIVSFKAKERPNITVLEIYGYIIVGFVLETIWLVVLVYFITDMLESISSVDRVRLFKALAIANVLLILIIVFAPNQILTHRKMFKEASMISHDNIYPHFPPGVHSRPAHYIALGVGVVLFIFTVVRIFALPDSMYTNGFSFWLPVLRLLGVDAFFASVSIFYYCQKRRSSDLIQKIRETQNRDPKARWRTPFNLVVD